MNLVQRVGSRLLRLPAESRGNLPLAAEQKFLGGDRKGLSTARIYEWLASISADRAHTQNIGKSYEQSVPVYAGIRMRAQAVARARLKAYFPEPNPVLTGGDEKIWVGDDHPVQRFLDRMNPWWTRSRMWLAVETNLCIWGSAFRWINRVDPEDVSTWEMWNLRPDKVVVVADPEHYIRGFLYDPHGARFPIMPEEMIWDRYYNPLEEYKGLSPLAAGLSTIEMHKEMIDTNREIFRNGVLASNWAFFLQGPLSDEDIERFQERVKERYATSGNAGRPIVLDQGQGDVRNLGFSNKEMEFLEGLQFSKEMMLTILGIEEEMIPGSRHSTFANRREANQHFYQNTITQEWDMLESEMQEQLIPRLPYPHQDLIVQFDKNDIEALAPIRSDKVQELIRLLSRGIITPNEVAAELGYSIKPWGDVWWAPTNIQPIDDDPDFMNLAPSGEPPVWETGTKEREDETGDGTGAGDTKADDPEATPGGEGLSYIGRGWAGGLYRQMTEERDRRSLDSRLDDSWAFSVKQTDAAAAVFRSYQDQIFLQQENACKAGRAGRVSRSLIGESLRASPAVDLYGLAESLLSSMIQENLQSWGRRTSRRYRSNGGRRT